MVIVTNQWLSRLHIWINDKYTPTFTDSAIKNSTRHQCSSLCCAGLTNLFKFPLEKRILFRISSRSNGIRYVIVIKYIYISRVALLELCIYVRASVSKIRSTVFGEQWSLAHSCVGLNVRLYDEVENTWRSQKELMNNGKEKVFFSGFSLLFLYTNYKATHAHAPLHK